MKANRLIFSLLASNLAVIASATGAPETQPVADGLTRTTVAREPLLKNPVVVSVDVDGSIYVVETARRLAADLDIREFKSWVSKTLALRTVADRKALYEKELVPGKVPANASIKDWNKDGVIDVKDLTVISEKIHRLRDTDGDGIMDQSNVFAEDFRTEVTGVAAGVMAWRGDVYAAIVPDLWKLRDTSGKGVADQREALLSGFGVHVAYAGHDMHGLLLGPDGRIYWTIGDKGLDVVSKEGKRWQVPDTGALMRCNPDGTGFEVVATGIRNVQQIAFDDFGNIFAVDNDSDAKGEKERFVHIAEGSDTGWRCYYQYRGTNYNPWMAESMSVPNGPNQPAFILPPVCEYMDGPSGFAHDPGTALNERYRHAFFMTSFPAGLLYSFKVEPQGAGFRMVDSHVVDKGPAYVGCNFGPDGALYLADWAGGYPLKEKGAVLKLDDSKVSNSPLRKAVAAMLKDGPAGVSDAELVKRLGHPDQRVRSDAHGELAKRPSGVALLTKAAADHKEQPLTCTHALWGLAQAHAFSPDLFKSLITAKAENTRAQAAKWAGEAAGKPVPELAGLLKDASPAVRYRAAIAIGKLHMDDAADAVIAMLEENANRDPWLRHAGVLALEGMQDSALKLAINHPSSAVRLAGAVVARRKSSAMVVGMLRDADPQIVSEAARAIYDEAGIPDAMPELAALLEKTPDAAAPAIRRAIAANRQLANAAAAARLANFAKDAARPADLRAVALNALASWPEAIELDSVDGRWHPLPAADVSLARAALAAGAHSLEQDGNASVAKAAATAAKALGIVANAAQLEKDIADVKLPPAVRLEAIEALKRVAPERFAELAPALLKDPVVGIRKGAASQLAGQAAATDYLLGAARNAADLSERQNAISLLARIPAAEARGELTTLLRHAEDTPEIQLELLDAAAVMAELKPEADRLMAALASKGALGPYLPSLAGGNAARGKEVFEAHLAASCTACHRIGEEGSNVGPPLTHVGSKERRYLLESLVLPQSVIAPGYGAMSVIRKDGTTVSGAPKSETTEVIVLLLPDGKELVIPRSEIASQTPAVSAMPPMGIILKPTELRDVVEFLSQQK